MQGLMQNWPLRVSTIIDHAARFHGDREIVTRTIEGPIARTTYGQVHLRARKVAQALTRLGIREGDIVATMAWWRHGPPGLAPYSCQRPCSLRAPSAAGARSYTRSW